MDGDKVVGVLSDREIFVMLFKLLEVGLDCTRITLADVNLQEGTLSKILKIVEDSNCTVRAVFTVPEGKNGIARVVLRTECRDSGVLSKNLTDNGFSILELKG